MKRLLIALMWIPTTILTLIVSLFFYSHYSTGLLAKNQLKQISQKPKFYQNYVSHPQTLGDSTAKVEAEDAVPELVYQYLKKYNSPMKETAHDFVRIFRSYNIDPIVPLAIAQCESNLGKKIPTGSYNPFGLGIHSQGSLGFESWQQGYEKMAKIIKQKYVDEGLTTVDEIMAKYCPLSLEKGGSWAKCVNQFVEEIETLTIRENKV